MVSATLMFGSHWCQTRNTSWRPRSRERPWILAGTKHSTLKVWVFSNKTQPQISDWDLKRKFKLDFSLHHKVAAGSWKFRLQLINNYINNNHLYSYILWSRVPHTSIVFCSLPTVHWDSLIRNILQDFHWINSRAEFYICTFMTMTGGTALFKSRAPHICNWFFFQGSQETTQLEKFFFLYVRWKQSETMS